MTCLQPPPDATAETDYRALQSQHRRTAGSGGTKQRSRRVEQERLSGQLLRRTGQSHAVAIHIERDRVGAEAPAVRKQLTASV